MDDLLSQGKDREPSPWPPRLLVLAILILLAVAIVRHLPTGRVAVPDRQAAALSAGPVQLAGLGSGAAGLLDHADRVVRSASPRPQALGSCRSRYLVLQLMWGQCGPR
jgi:hypothetical protein